jgi:tetratricopeptide (TPR) repeat protein
MKLTSLLFVLIIGVFLFPPSSSIAQKSARQSQKTKTAKQLYEEASSLVGRGDAECALEDFREAIADYDEVIRVYLSQGPKKPVGPKKPAGNGVETVHLSEFDALEASYAIGIVYFKRGLAKEALGDRAGACKDFSEYCQWEQEDFKTFKVCNNESAELRTTHETSKAQKQSVPSKLEGTRWEAIHPGEIYSPILERSLNRRFFCAFEKQGRVSCSVIATASSKIKNEQYYDPIEKRIRYRQVLIPSSTFPVENRSGTYKLDGNSVHIELSAYEIEATVKENSMGGSITFNLESRQKARWVARRVTGEANN